jgi:hypothetical protein
MNAIGWRRDRSNWEQSSFERITRSTYRGLGDLIAIGRQDGTGLTVEIRVTVARSRWTNTLAENNASVFSPNPKEIQNLHSREPWGGRTTWLGYISWAIVLIIGKTVRVAGIWGR